MEMLGFVLFFVFGGLAGFFYAKHKYSIKGEDPQGSSGGGGGAKRTGSAGGGGGSGPKPQ